MLLDCNKATQHSLTFISKYFFFFHENIQFQLIFTADKNKLQHLRTAKTCELQHVRNAFPLFHQHCSYKDDIVG
jgi:hypothetical protein